MEHASIHTPIPHPRNSVFEFRLSDVIISSNPLRIDIYTGNDRVYIRVETRDTVVLHSTTAQLPPNYAGSLTGDLGQTIRITPDGIASSGGVAVRMERVVEPPWWIRKPIADLGPVNGKIRGDGWFAVLSTTDSNGKVLLWNGVLVKVYKHDDSISIVYDGLIPIPSGSRIVYSFNGRDYVPSTLVPAGDGYTIYMPVRGRILHDPPKVSLLDATPTLTASYILDEVYVGHDMAVGMVTVGKHTTGVLLPVADGDMDGVRLVNLKPPYPAAGIHDVAVLTSSSRKVPLVGESLYWRVYLDKHAPSPRYVVSVSSSAGMVESELSRGGVELVTLNRALRKVELYNMDYSLYRATMLYDALVKAKMIRKRVKVAVRNGRVIGLVSESGDVLAAPVTGLSSPG